MVTQLIGEGYQKENMELQISKPVDGLTQLSYFLKYFVLPDKTKFGQSNIEKIYHFNWVQKKVK